MTKPGKGNPFLLALGWACVVAGLVAGVEVWPW
jgi:hypothetical protein